MPGPHRLSSLRERARDARLDPLHDWPHGAARFGVVVCVAVVVAFGLVDFAQALDRLGNDAGANAALNFDDREFAGGNALVVDKALLYEARGTIAKNDRYRVVIGPNVQGATDLTQYVDQYARYFLMPRRQDPGARWVLCYGCELAELGASADVRWKDDQGLALVRLRS